MSDFFGVLFRRDRMLRQPGSLCFKEDLTAIVEVCVFMHDLTVTERKAGYTGTRMALVAAEEEEADDAGASMYRKLVSLTELRALVNWLHEVEEKEQQTAQGPQERPDRAHARASRGCCSGREQRGWF